LGRLLAEAGFTLIYGGSSVGLMGLLASAALEAGGRAIGVRPNWLFPDEPAHTALTELHEVSSMHERKQLMFTLSEAFLVLPGGLGTLEEFFEVVSWSQLGLHTKPIITVDIDGYWNHLFDFLASAQRRGFIQDRHAKIIQRAGSPSEAIALLTLSLRTADQQHHGV
jgi:hypothetical protein